jgi:hypothetical protein
MTFCEPLFTIVESKHYKFTNLLIKAESCFNTKL